MAEVPSYTDIIDGVNEITSKGHINLLETFAERIAAHCLKDKRIASVRVRIEKLERGPVRGVDITRARAGAAVKPLVVKIGGSLVETGRLREILAIVARRAEADGHRAGRRTVRRRRAQAQAEFGFSDEAAHEMAILAMHRLALLMTRDRARVSSRRRRWPPCAGLGQARRVAVWMPARLCAARQAHSARLVDHLGRSRGAARGAARPRAGRARQVAAGRRGVRARRRWRAKASSIPCLPRSRRVPGSNGPCVGPGEERRRSRPCSGCPRARRSGRSAKKAPVEASTARR